MYVHLNPTAVTEDVGLSEPVYVSLMTSGGCLSRLNMVAFATRRQMVCSTQLLGPTVVHRTTMYSVSTHCKLLCCYIVNMSELTNVIDETWQCKEQLHSDDDVEEVHWVDRSMDYFALLNMIEVK